jgi:hypothetical protein
MLPEVTHDHGSTAVRIGVAMPCSEHLLHHNKQQQVVPNLQV